MRALKFIFVWKTGNLAQGLTSFSTGVSLPFSQGRTLAHSVVSRSALTMAATSTIPSWSELQTKVGETPVGQALNQEVKLRSKGLGAANVDNTLRVFDSSSTPEIVLYRDKAGWCPYCQKMMLLVEEKKIPVKISTVPMRSYGDKPTEFMRKVPNGLLPAMEINGKIITESSVIMELLDRWHAAEDGYLAMMPKESDEAGRKRYERLFALERRLFSWWCTLLFRPESGGGGNNGNFLSNLMNGGSSGEMSASIQGFLDCMKQVDAALRETKGPWFFGENDHPTMIDFIYVSHVERMLASCAYWKGLNLRDPKWNLPGVNAWLDAFEKREAYLGFKSDYYTHIKDIPPQYGPGYDGGFEQDRRDFSNLILGKVCECVEEIRLSLLDRILRDLLTLFFIFQNCGTA
jgi:glutathione S-transferase